MVFFKYCPNCKAKIKKSNRLIDCTSCGFRFYLNPVPTNGLIVQNEKGEILLVKRKSNPKKGFWDVPGGFVDFGETLEESMIREIKEELGVKVKDLRYLISTPDRYLYKVVNYHTLCFFFTGKVKARNLKAKSDITEIKFFPKNNIPYAKIAFSGAKKAIKYYLSSFNQPDNSPKTK